MTETRRCHAAMAPGSAGDGTPVVISGWVDAKRDHGRLTFIDLRDSSGKIQCVARGVMGDLSLGDVVEVTGLVQRRPANMVNPDLATGEVEISVSSCAVLNRSKPLPIPDTGDGRDIAEELRLRFRYLDLRRPRMQQILRLRSDLVHWLGFFLRQDFDFISVDTPLLTKATKEGARDFVVPSRMHPGTFYALPQSPQQYKQLLMTAGVEKYYQIARCLRDENLRADRGFEFTQLDLEMAFTTEQHVRYVVEEVLRSALHRVGAWDRLCANSKGFREFPVLQYSEAVGRFGSDKPDLRTAEQKEKGMIAFCWVVRHPFFKKVESDDVDSKSNWTFTHNPFSRPVDEHVDRLLKGEQVSEIISTQYDLVCNGYEVGGGSLRAHTPEMLAATFRIMGYDEPQIRESVGHMLTAFELGTPPHGGIALGIDRLLMILAGEESLKEVIPFPLTNTGRTAVMDAPCAVSAGQMKELGITAAAAAKEKHVSV